MLCIMFRIVFLPISSPCSHIIKNTALTNFNVLTCKIRVILARENVDIIVS